MVYEAPEAKIFCFAPIQNIANDDWNWATGDGTGSASEIDFPFDNSEEGDPNN